MNIYHHSSLPSLLDHGSLYIILPAALTTTIRGRRRLVAGEDGRRTTTGCRPNQARRTQMGSPLPLCNIVTRFNCAGRRYDRVGASQALTNSSTTHSFIMHSYANPPCPHENTVSLDILILLITMYVFPYSLLISAVLV